MELEPEGLEARGLEGLDVHPPLGQVGVLVAGDHGDRDLGAGVDDGLESALLGEGEVGADDDDLGGPEVSGIACLAGVLRRVVAELFEDLLVALELGLEVVQELGDGLAVGDPAGAEGVLELGADADRGDREVVGPLRRGQGDREGPHDGHGGLGGGVDAECGEVLEVDEDLVPVGVGADRDERRVGRDDVRDRLVVGQGGCAGQQPRGGVLGGLERRGQLVGRRGVQLEVVIGQAREADIGKSLAVAQLERGEGAQSAVDEPEHGGVLDAGEADLVEVDRRGLGDPLVSTALALGVQAASQDRAEDAGGEDRADPGPRHGGGLLGLGTGSRCRGRGLGAGGRGVGRGICLRGLGGGKRVAGCVDCLLGRLGGAGGGLLVGGRLLLMGGLLVGLVRGDGGGIGGHAQRPADVDLVGVLEVVSAGLGDVCGGFGDFGPPVGVAEVLVGDRAQALPTLDGDRLVLLLSALGSCVGGGDAGDGQLPSGLEEGVLSDAERTAVRLDLAVVGLHDLAPLAAGAKVLRGEIPGGVSGLHGDDEVLGRGGGGVLVVALGLGGRLLGGHGGGLSGLHGWCDLGRGLGHRGGRTEPGDRGNEDGCGALLGAEPAQLRSRDVAHAGDDLDHHGQGEGGPGDPPDPHHHEQQEADRVVGREQVRDVLGARELLRDRVPVEGEQGERDPADEGGEHDEGAERLERLDHGRTSVCPWMRSTRAVRVAETEWMPMRPRKTVSSELVTVTSIVVGSMTRAEPVAPACER